LVHCLDEIGALSTRGDADTGRKRGGRQFPVAHISFDLGMSGNLHEMAVGQKRQCRHFVDDIEPAHETVVRFYDICN